MTDQDDSVVVQLAPAPYVLPAVAAAITGYTVKAIARKIEATIGNSKEMTWADK